MVNFSQGRFFTGPAVLHPLSADAAAVDRADIIARILQPIHLPLDDSAAAAVRGENACRRAQTAPAGRGLHEFVFPMPTTRTLRGRGFSVLRKYSTARYRYSWHLSKVKPRSAHSSRYSSSALFSAQRIDRYIPHGASNLFPSACPTLGIFRSSLIGSSFFSIIPIPARDKTSLWQILPPSFCKNKKYNLILLPARQKGAILCVIDLKKPSEDRIWKHA